MRCFFSSFLLAFVFFALPVTGQNHSEHTRWLKLVNEKGKPIKRTSVIYQIGNQPAGSKTDKEGAFLLNGVTGTDTVTVLVSGYYPGIFLPLGADSIQLTLTKTGVGDSEVGIGFQSVSSQNNTLPASQLTPDKRASIYSDLASYLQGRSGLQIQRGARGSEVIIRGGNNSLYKSSGALIVVDGVTFNDFETVNNLINPNDVKSVSILKDGSIYGSQGANGVVIITTKRGGK